jgi:peptidoglycan hydrolase-like amidase
MRAGYVLHSLECLERGVVDKYCSNMLRPLRAYEVVSKAVRTYVRVRRAIQRTCVAHDVQSHTHTPVYTCMRQIQTHVHALHVYLPSLQCTMQ